MGDTFANRETDLDSPARAGGDPIVPDDNADLNPVPRFLTVVGAGTLRVTMAKDKNVVDLDADEVAALGPYVMLNVSRVHATGTTATKIRGWV